MSTGPARQKDGIVTGIVVRMHMPIEQAAWFSENSRRLPADVRERVADQLWLRVVLNQQRHRVRIPEREAFDARADRILTALDPPEQGHA